MSTAAHPATAPGGHPDRPGFWRAPFSRQALQDLGFALTGLPMAVLGFTLVVTLFCLGLGLAVTVLGLPVLGLLLAVARGLGAAERGRIRNVLGEEVPAPPAVVVAREGFWGRITARLADPAGWKAVLHQFVMLPWAILNFTLSLTFFLLGWSLALFPVYQWVFRRYTSWGGYRVAEWTTSDGVHHAYEITSLWQIAGVCLLGLVILFLTPPLIRGLNGVNRSAARALLSSDD
ncbi:sensor domain-containing protein [Kitasatospora sp. NA04385]|uniref:sensor domain-containing protein n=1 Tax=Kitasatospora sp. NA04385 TaxID=2742135 RepID=UPI00158FFAC1|nr:sensor domain-containing protein [Kitasatospora sp. NA04385]QKW20994.1 sensor domain-containing protein [Kitasatospora sp. NA04385]